MSTVTRHGRATVYDGVAPDVESPNPPLPEAAPSFVRVLDGDRVIYTHPRVPEAGVVPLLPSQIANLTLWYKADSALVTLNDNDPVSGWPCEDEAQWHAGGSMFGSANVVYRSSAINGAPAWYFTGDPAPLNRSYLNFPFAIPLQFAPNIQPDGDFSFDLFVCGKYGNSCDGSMFLDYHSSNGVICAAFTPGSLYNVSDAALDFNDTPENEFGPNTPVIIEVALDVPSMQGFAYRNGELRAQGAVSGPNIGLTHTLGCGAEGQEGYANCYVSEVCVFKRKLTDAERAGITAYMKQRMGIA